MKRATLSVLVIVGVAACGSGPTEPPRNAVDVPTKPQLATGAAAMPVTQAPAPLASEPPPSREPSRTSDAPVEAAGKDPGVEPLTGPFSLADATAGLSGTGALVATLKTNLGDVSCKLFADKAPNSVANFVGLARGVRPFKDPTSLQWVKRPAYDGTSFHRIIKGFMIQGGDPTGTGRGEPGFVIADEVWAGSKHDRAGLLCMANRGPNTNGMQFFITDASAPHLDGTYTIFGECSPATVVHALANVPVGAADRPDQPVTIRNVTIARSASSAKPAAAAPTPASPPKPAP